MEHKAHVLHLGGIETGYIHFCQISAAAEHILHGGHIGGHQVLTVHQNQIVAAVEHVAHIRGVIRMERLLKAGSLQTGKGLEQALTGNGSVDTAVGSDIDLVGTVRLLHGTGHHGTVLFPGYVPAIVEPVLVQLSQAVQEKHGDYFTPGDGFVTKGRGVPGHGLQILRKIRQNIAFPGFTGGHTMLLIFVHAVVDGPGQGDVCEQVRLFQERRFQQFIGSKVPNLTAIRQQQGAILGRNRCGHTGNTVYAMEINFSGAGQAVCQHVIRGFQNGTVYSHAYHSFAVHVNGHDILPFVILRQIFAVVTVVKRATINSRRCNQGTVCLQANGARIIRRDRHDIRPVFHVQVVVKIPSCRYHSTVRFQAQGTSSPYAGSNLHIHNIRPIGYIALLQQVITHGNHCSVGFQTDNMLISHCQIYNICPATYFAGVKLSVCTGIDHRTVGSQTHQELAGCIACP